jgi:hypothetical protein
MLNRQRHTVSPLAEVTAQSENDIDQGHPVLMEEKNPGMTCYYTGTTKRCVNMNIT